MASCFHGLSELLLADVSCNEKTNGNYYVYNSDFIRRLNARVGPRGSFKRSFSTARHKIGDQLAFLFAHGEPSHYGFTTPLRGNNIGFIKFSSSATCAELYDVSRMQYVNNLSFERDLSLRHIVRLTFARR